MKKYAIYHCGDHQGLLSYFQQHSDMISLARHYNGRLLGRIPFVKQHPKVQQALWQGHKEWMERVDWYRRVLGYDNNETEVLELFDGLLKQTMKAIGANRRGRTYYAPELPEEERDRPFSSTNPEYLGKWYTWISGVTIGPMFEVCYFDIGNKARGMLESMQSLFDLECRMDGIVFQDPAFYWEGKPLLEICSHEGHAVFSASDETLAELREYGINPSAI